MSVQKLHLTQNDQRIVLICATLLAVVLFFLLNDRWLAHLVSRQIQTGEKIGSIQKGKNDVRRKDVSDFIWMPISKSDDIYDADTIYTGKDSSTEIQLEEGGGIALDQQSLIVIRKGQVDLLEGAVWTQISANQELKLNTPKGEILIHASAEKIRKVKVEMSPTGPKVYAEDPQIQVEQAGQKIEAIKTTIADKTAVYELVPPDLLFPQMDSAIPLGTEATKEILFQWSAKDKTENYEITLSNNSEFKDVLWTKRVPELGVLSKPLPAGDYFWRVRSTDNAVAASSTSWSKIGHFKITGEEVQRAPTSVPEKLKAPELKLKHQLFKHNSNTKYEMHPWEFFFAALFTEKAMAQENSADELEWKEVPGAVTYDLEISKDPNFKKIYKKESLGQAKYIWEERKSGTFYWRVRGVGIDNLPGEFSETASFEVQIETPVKPQIKVTKAEHSASPEQMQETIFHWNRIAFAESYELQFSTDESFAHPQKLNVEDNSLKVKLSSIQKYWRVRALVKPEQYSGEFSAPHEIAWEGSTANLVPGLKLVRLKKMDRIGKVPTLFSPQDNGVNLSNPGISYALQKGTRLILGEAEVNLGLIDFEITKDSAGKSVARMSWPKEFFHAGKLSLQAGKEGNEIANLSFSRLDLKLNTGKVSFDVPWTAEKAAQLATGSGDIRFCVERTQASLVAELCSAHYQCDLKDDRCSRAPSPSTTAVNVNGTPAPVQGLATVDETHLTTLNIHDLNGNDIRIETKLKTQGIKDIVAQSDGILIISGIGAVPLNQHLLEREQLNWRAAVFPNNPKVYFPGENAVPIRINLVPSKKLPQEIDRAYIAAQSPRGTYNESIKLQGLFNTPGKIVSSTETSAQNSGEKDFTWDYAAPRKIDSNNSRLAIKNQDGQFIGNYELYRGNHFELDGNVSDVFTSAGSIFLGKLIFSDWFETFLKCENPKWCFQHWGFTASVFNSTTSTDQLGNAINLHGYYADLRYRFRSGINNRDPSTGLTLRYENLSFSGASVNYLGIGAFYTLPTPSLVNHVLDYFSWFRFPKVLDMELTYYPAALSSGVSLGNSPNLEVLLKGKMFVRPSFFIEGGIGFQQLFYTVSGQSAIQAYIFDLKGGVGWDF